MAAGFPVKANYATGDVLSAANMNDLSGTLNYIDPTGKTNGYVLTRNSSATGGLEWAAAGGGGSSGALTLISTTSFSSVSSISLPNSTFSSTYDDYLVFFNATNMASTGYVQARLRASGSDNTSASYGSGFIVNSITTTQITNDYGNSGQTSFSKFAYSYASNPLYVQFFLRSPFASRRTSYNGTASGMGNEYWTLGGMFDNTTSFDAMTIYSGGNMTGAVSVYGISK